MSGSGISWAVCKSAPRSSQITMPAPHHSVFYRPDALPAAQPTASKHWRQCYRERKCAENYDKWYNQNFGDFLLVFLQAGCPSCVSGEGSWIIINDMTEMTNILSKAITFLLHQVSYTLAHTVRNFCCCCVSRSRFVYTSISYFVAFFLHFVARFVVVVGFTRIRSKCADIKTLHPTSVAAVYFDFCVISLAVASQKVSNYRFIFFSAERPNAVNILTSWTENPRGID